MQIKIFLAVITLLPAIVFGVETYQATVVGITDGDTIKVLRAGNEQVKIRLAEIDCPERKQPWGTKAKQAVSELVMGRTVKIEVIDVDRYGRTVGKVFVDEQNVNRALVEDGHCWAYVEYVRDTQLPVLQEQAKAASRGLWQLPESERMPPWEWRRNRR